MPDAQEPQREMPRYRSHKEVRALKIRMVKQAAETDGLIIVPEDEGFAPFTVSSEYANKHTPAPGGYYVVYEDGYESWSPAKAFEEGYTLIEENRPLAPICPACGHTLEEQVSDGQNDGWWCSWCDSYMRQPA